MQGKIIKDRRGNSLQKYVPLAFIMKIRCCGQHSRLIPSAAFFFPARFWRQRQDGFPGAEKPYSYNALSQCVAELCRDLCRRDFAALAERPAQTHGEKLYVGFGITGVRGEAEQGFPLVCQIGLPALHQALDNGLAWREALIHTLLTLMAHCDDTTVLFRGGQQALAEMKQYARRLVTQGGMFNPAIEQQLADFNSWCMDKWVSPGGSADLLALCLAMYFLCRQPQGDMT